MTSSEIASYSWEIRFKEWYSSKDIKTRSFPFFLLNDSFDTLIHQLALYFKSFFFWIIGRILQFFLYPQQLIVLRHTVTS